MSQSAISSSSRRSAVHTRHISNLPKKPGAPKNAQLRRTIFRKSSHSISIISGNGDQFVTNSRESGTRFGQNTVASNFKALEQGERLANWVRDNGGYVHEALALTEDTECGSRGICSREAIEGHDATLPLVVVPELLYLTGRSADRLLSPALESLHKPPLRESLSPGMQLAALLAHHRRSDWQDEEATPYAAYVAALPPQPPCPWLLPPADLAAALSSLDLGWAQRRHWAAEVATAAKHAMSQAAHASRVLSPAHDIDPVDIAWGMAQIASRAFGGIADPGMAPYIDLFNHNEAASHPIGVDDDAAAPGGPHYCVTSLWNGRPTDIAAGSELYISYDVLDNKMPPLNVFLNFGPAAGLMMPPGHKGPSLLDRPDGKSAVHSSASPIWNPTRSI